MDRCGCHRRLCRTGSGQTRAGAGRAYAPSTARNTVPVSVRSLSTAAAPAAWRSSAVLLPVATPTARTALARGSSDVVRCLADDGHVLAVVPHTVVLLGTFDGQPDKDGALAVVGAVTADVLVEVAGQVEGGGWAATGPRRTSRTSAGLAVSRCAVPRRRGSPPSAMPGRPASLRAVVTDGGIERSPLPLTKHRNAPRATRRPLRIRPGRWA